MKIIFKRLSISFFMIALAFLIGCGCGAVKQARANMIKAGEWSYLANDDGNAIITCYYGSETNVVIPEEIEGNKVIGFLRGTFNNHSALTSVSISEGIIAIGMGAFYECRNLTSIFLPQSVTLIGTGAFVGCNSLKNISIPPGVTSIEDSTFYGCSSLTSISLPPNVTSIGNFAFTGCSALTSISLPPSVTTIGSFTFGGCRTLTSISIPKHVTTIGESPFTYCSNLVSIAVENGNPKYDSRNNCNAIIKTGVNVLVSGCRNTTIPPGVTKIGDFAFSGCSSLTSISLPPSVTSIGASAFLDCSSLKKIIIPKSVTKIKKSTDPDEDVFYGCPADLVIWTTKNSYAAKYAKEQGIKVHYTDTPAQTRPSASSMTVKGGLKLTAGKKKLTLTWKKLVKASGYEIQISQKKNFKGARKHKIKNSKKSLTIKNLKSGKVYYVRIRAFTKTDGKKVYGKWAVAKKKVK